MCKSTITLKKFIKLVFEMQFYKTVFYTVFWVTGYDQFPAVKLRELLLPIRSVGSNFSGCYLLFCLFIPFLNILINHLSEKKHLLLVFLTIKWSIPWTPQHLGYY